MPPTSDWFWGPQRKLYIAGGPHTITSTSSCGGAEYFLMRFEEIKPLSPIQSEVDGSADKTCLQIKRPSEFLDQALNKSSAKISLLVLLPKSSVTRVVSFCMPRIACNAWIIGVMPVPPASMVMYRLLNGYWICTLSRLCLNSKVSPIGASLKTRDIVPFL